MTAFPICQQCECRLCSWKDGACNACRDCDGPVISCPVGDPKE